MNQLETFVVGAESAGRRLDDFLAARMHRLSRMRIAGLVAAGACAVNGAAAHAGRKLSTGDVVQMTAGDDVPNAMTPEPLPLDVVYEDAHLLVVNKPAGLLAHPTRGVKSGTLANALVHHLNRELLESVPDETNLDTDAELIAHPATHFTSFVRPGLVHRLDRATSGLMVVAKTREALSRLAGHFHRRLVEKRYLAVLHGEVGEEEMTINAPIGRVAERHPAWGVTAEGKAAETRLRVVERRGPFTLVELEPVTGRTNQLRIHCAHAGHAIAGDEWYASDRLPRLCLHAARLAFRHPADNRPCEFLSPLPAELREIFDGRGLSGPLQN
jgi:23S rRNA pseudouridine1911/1915/1917 synthase